MLTFIINSFCNENHNDIWYKYQVLGEARAFLWCEIREYCGHKHKMYNVLIFLLKGLSNSFFIKSPNVFIFLLHITFILFFVLSVWYGQTLKQSKMKSPLLYCAHHTRDWLCNVLVTCSFHISMIMSPVLHWYHLHNE